VDDQFGTHRLAGRRLRGGHSATVRMSGDAGHPHLLDPRPVSLWVAACGLYGKSSLLAGQVLCAGQLWPIEGLSSTTIIMLTLT
jgi:hypothetical protein